MQPLFNPYDSEYPVAKTEYSKMITLPLHADLTNEEVKFIIENLKNFEKYS